MKKRLFLSVIGIFVLLTTLSAKDPDVYLYQVDPLDKVLKDRRYFRDEVDTLCVARGETTSLQIVLQANREISALEALVEAPTFADNELHGAHTGWVGYVRAGRRYSPQSKDLLHSPSDYFPDPILTDTLINLRVGEIQPLWITLPIAKNAAPGLYKGTVIIQGNIDGKKRSWNKDFYIRVFPVTIEGTSLLISNWSAHIMPTTLRYFNNMEDVELFSDLYWELTRLHAEIMASHGQTVHRIFPSWMSEVTYDNGRYTFDFSRFDKEVEIFEAVGALHRIEGGHLAWRSGSWDQPFYVEVALPDNEESRKLKPSPYCALQVDNGIRRVLLPIDDPRTQNYLDQFLPALKSHLIAKGWYDKYMQHIADEPVPKNADSYGQISNYVKKHMPEVKIMDAVLTSKELAGTIDVWIPELSVLHRDWNFYKELKSQGKEVWFYTCVGPRGNYANRFLELPLIQTRILHWINYKYDLTGYLHWGLNYWGDNPLYANSSRDRGKLPAGDCNIIYPGYRKIYSSIRFDAMRDGIYDYELLKMLGKKNPAKAREYVNAIVMNFDNYDSDFDYFQRVRRGILIHLSE